MPARSPRRSFSRSLVVTLAAVPACFVQSSTPPSQSVSQPNPGQPETSDPHPTPPPPERQTPTVIVNPPRPSNPPPPEQPQPVPTEQPTPSPSMPGADSQWMVTKTPRGCEARAVTHCPAHALCNPPPPHAYSCIDGAEYPATLTKHDNVCTVNVRVYAHVNCPPNVMCNPPPPHDEPKTVPCP